MNGLKKNSLNTWQIIFFVISAAAPLTGMLGTVPTSIILGNGAGISGAYLISGMILLIFSVGFAAMSRHVINAGAFYAYISQGLGSHIGIGAGFVALISYTAIQLALYGLFGFFCDMIINNSIHVILPWYFYSFFALSIIHMLGYYKIDLNIRLLGVLMLLEISILLMLSVAIIIHFHTMSIKPLMPKVIFQHQLGISIMFALASFIGFEATAIYGEECKNGVRSVPIATYTSVFAIMIFFAFVTLNIVNAYGIDCVVGAANKNPGNFWFLQCTKYLGKSATTLMRFLLLTSIFSSLLAFHHTLARYFFAMSRENVLPVIFTKIHPLHHSPYKASQLQTSTACVGIMLFIIGRAHPYDVMFTSMSTLGTIGITSLQLLVSIAVIVYFYRTKNDTRFWHAKVAPMLGVFGLAYALSLIINNLTTLSGIDNIIIRSFPWLILIVFISGAVINCLMKRN